MLGLGKSPTRPGVAVDLTGLTQVIDYPARDMTITVQAGISVAKLQEILRAENQRLPVDVPRPEQATLGGALAVNASGPRRLGYGTLRDYVIGISVINDEGHEVKAGGRVVKNVAGYDMAKLYIGSLGTLGIITQVTLKVRPVPERWALAFLSCPSATVAQVLDALHVTPLRPVCVELLNHRAVEATNEYGKSGCQMLPLLGGSHLLVGFEEKAPTVTWEVEQFQNLVPRLPSGMTLHDIRQGEGECPSDQQFATLVDMLLRDDAALSFKANLLPSAVASFLEEASALPDGLALQAHAGSGIVIGHAPASLTRERAAAMLTLLQQKAVAAQGNVIVQRCPAAWKAELPIWGAPRGDDWLMRTVKEKLDPENWFNPGRFLV
jgi:glycolate oxidase FAD binding subunit